jgi:hypothetical protein
VAGESLLRVQTAALELIAAQLAYLVTQAEANDLNLVAFLIDIALSEAREELAIAE